MVAQLKEEKLKADKASSVQTKQLSSLQEQVSDLVAMNSYVRPHAFRSLFIFL